jgi:hypothetical protein
MCSTSIMRRWSSRETATNAEDQRAITARSASLRSG